MPKLISVHTNSRLVECPDQWAQYKNVPVECSIYESVKKQPGKRWFYIFDDSDLFTVSYFHCNMGDATYSEDGKTVSFDTISGSHYVVELGEEQDIASYIPYRLVGQGGDVEVLPGTAAIKEVLENSFEPPSRKS